MDNPSCDECKYGEKRNFAIICRSTMPCKDNALFEQKETTVDYNTSQFPEIDIKEEQCCDTCAFGSNITCEADDPCPDQNDLVYWKPVVEHDFNVGEYLHNACKKEPPNALDAELCETVYYDEGHPPKKITTPEDFEIILNNRIDQIKKVLGHKAKEYALGGDRLHNFKVAGRMDNKTPQQALWGMMLKHRVSVEDLVEGRLEATVEMINEKVGDTINYLILLEALLKEKL